MAKFLIEPTDLPSAKLNLQTLISAGRGWLDLVKKAVAIAAGEPILSIKEKAGLLTVIVVTKDAEKLQQLDDLPVGMQIIGRHHEDQLLLDLAAIVERERPWPLVAPASPV